MSSSRIVTLVSYLLLTLAFFAFVAAQSSFVFQDALPGNWKIDISQYNVDDLEAEVRLVSGNATLTKDAEGILSANYNHLSDIGDVLSTTFLRFEFENAVSGAVRMGAPRRVSAVSVGDADGNDDDDAETAAAAETSSEDSDELGLSDLLRFSFYEMPSRMWLSQGYVKLQGNKSVYEAVVYSPSGFTVSFPPAPGKSIGYTVVGSKIHPEKGFFEKYGSMITMLLLFIGVRTIFGRNQNRGPAQEDQEVARQNRQQPQQQGAASSPAAAAPAAGGDKKRN